MSEWRSRATALLIRSVAATAAERVGKAEGFAATGTDASGS